MSGTASAGATRYRCHGCGAVVEAGGADPFRCPNYGEGDTDHVLVLERTAPPSFPAADNPEDNPFLRFLPLFHFTHAAAAAGLPVEDLAALVRDLDRRVARIEGRADGIGFRITPCERSAGLSNALGFAEGGGLWVKDETGQVAGSHKARHLFGVLVHLEAQRFRGDGVAARQRLAIASCGNAALAAGIVARAGGSDLTVFVPEHADRAIVGRLRNLRAEIETCARRGRR
ncbi:PLP-dependent lyase/thiolase, partial [bacterium]|nr:PLP-dependent lyase/thiolase [bacterium]